MKIANYIKEMTLEEKAAILSGTEFWMTNQIPRLDIPSIYMADGPIGLRKQDEQADHMGLNKSEQTTCFPAGVTIASSWNPENARRMGEAIADECHYYGVNILLGPAVNIKKNPRCGRNFEYYSEDPYLSGIMGTEFVKGVQDDGIGVSVKHFAANNNENYRFMGDSIVDERALREIYLKAFEMIIKEANPTTVMCAYNKINGIHCSENKHLLTEILRDEWKYDGVVISDWGAVVDRAKGIQAGMDLEMPGDCKKFRSDIITSVKNGSLAIQDVDKGVINILKLIERTKDIDTHRSFDKEYHSKLSGDIAADCAVLLKNNGSLPLNKNKRYLVVGDLFQKMRYQGSGSSIINPTQVISPKQAFDNRNLSYKFVRGYLASEVTPDHKQEEDALNASKAYDEIIFFGGQTDTTESEGYDRDHLELPENQIALLYRFISLGKKVILVLFGGSPVELPFEDKISAILNMYLPGQSGGEATTALLFGEKSPSGKLAETWPMTYKDIPFGDEYITSQFELYKESIYVGYRYYDKLHGHGVRYPFGFGLSYTTFTYSNLVVKEKGNSVTVTCDIINTGNRDGAEVVQLYIGNPPSNVFKAEKELRAFTKVYLKKGETKQAVMTFKRSDLSYYHVHLNKWVLENGYYQLLIGASSIDIRLTADFVISGEPSIEIPYSQNELVEYYDVSNLTKVSNDSFERLLGFPLPNLNLPKIPVTIESKLADYRYSFFGRIIYNAVIGVGRRKYKKALRLPEGDKRDREMKNGLFLMKILPNNNFRSMAASSSGLFPMKMAFAVAEITNGHYIKGLNYILKKESVPPLPKNKIKGVHHD